MCQRLAYHPKAFLSPDREAVAEPAIAGFSFNHSSGVPRARGAPNPHLISRTVTSPEIPRAVSSVIGREVSSLYCAYIPCRRKIEVSPGAQSRDDTPGWRWARRARPELHRCSESRAAYLIATLDQDGATIVGDW